jgi:hypothetical protein
LRGKLGGGGRWGLEKGEGDRAPPTFHSCFVTVWDITVWDIKINVVAFTFEGSLGGNHIYIIIEHNDQRHAYALKIAPT